MNNFFLRLMLGTACCTATFFSGSQRSTIHAQESAINLGISSPASFEVLDLSKTSIRFADSDAAFYSASFQLEDQWKSFVQGAVVQEALKSNIAQKYAKALKAQWEERSGPIGELRRNIENPNIANVLQLLQDMVSEEVFILGSSELPSSLVALHELTSDIQAVAMEGPEGVNEYIMSLQKEQFDAIQIPTLVFGGKIENKELALQQIDILEALATVALNNAPQLQDLQDGLKRIEDESGTRLTMTVKSSMIPWDDLAQNPGLSDMVSKFETLLEDRQLSLSLGTFNEFLIISISESPDGLKALSDVESSLLDADVLKLVKSKASEQVIGISYLSDAMAEANFNINLDGYFSKNIGQFVSIAQLQIEQQLEFVEDDEAEKLEATLDLLDSIPDDLEWLDEQIGQHIPEMKGQTGVAVAKPDGMESWLESRTENVLWEPQASLPVLQQLGGSPIGFFAARCQFHPEYFQTSRAIVRKVRSYLDRIVVGDIVDEEEAEELDSFLTKGWPILVQLADIVEQDFIPATKDGQFAWVLSESSITAKQWLADMPPSDTELPLLEFAEIWGVSDSEKLQEGFKKLYELFDEVVEVVREVDENAVPENYSVPRPEKRDNAAGNNYVYPIPEECPVPESMALQALFTDNFAYFNYSQPQMEKLSKKTALSVQEKFFSAEKTIGAVLYFDLGRLFTQLKPWVIYGATLSPDEVVIPSENDFPEVTKSDILELLGALEKCGEFISVESGKENGSVTHGRYFRK